MGKDDNDDSAVQPSPADEANVNLTTLDLSCAIGTTLTVRQVERLLFPSRRNRVDEEPPQSWDVPAPMRPSFALLPNLTRLSLAVRPGSRAPVSWTQLLHLSSRLKGLTQLSLAYWPRPSCAAVADYEDPSHLESWDDAVAIVNRLSSYTYMLELLDLTGCHSWAFTLLLAREMDWAKNWGRLEKVKVYPNRPSSGKSNKTLEDDLRRSLETHVRFVRKGRRGPWCTFTVV